MDIRQTDRISLMNFHEHVFKHNTIFTWKPTHKPSSSMASIMAPIRHESEVKNGDEEIKKGMSERLLKDPLRHPLRSSLRPSNL
jgi:hypothetical protein